MFKTSFAAVGKTTNNRVFPPWNTGRRAHFHWSILRFFEGEQYRVNKPKTKHPAKRADDKGTICIKSVISLRQTVLQYICMPFKRELQRNEKPGTQPFIPFAC
jgi:hypothetical protein